MRNLLALLILAILFTSGCVSQSTIISDIQDNGNIPGAGSEEVPEPGSEDVETHIISMIQPLIIPDSIADNCLGLPSASPEEMSFVKEMGAGWTRPHTGPFAWEWVETGKGIFDFSNTDKYAVAAQDAGVAILATVWPFAGWDQSSCHGDECRVGPEDIFYSSEKVDDVKVDEKGVGDITGDKGTEELMGVPISRCRPCSMDDYKNFLAKLVERYDGDGTDDMPGLKFPIKYWEVSNEPDMQNPPLTFFIGTEQDYVDILKASWEAIKAACPDCLVVQGGAAGLDPDMVTFWKNIFDLGGADYFDISNIHYIRHDDYHTLNVAGWKAILDEKGIDKPIWVTETELPVEDTAQMEASFQGALDAGASKILMTQFKVNGDPKGLKETNLRIASKCP